MVKKLRQNLLAFGFLLWAVSIIAAYFVVHKPTVFASRDFNFIWVLVDILLAVLLTGLAGGIGRKLIGPLEECEPLERIPVYFAFGLGVTGLCVLALGLLGALFSWIAWMLFFIGLFLFKGQTLEWFADWNTLWQGTEQKGRFEKITIAFVLLIVLIQLCEALAPPTKWDSLVYHLELPHQYLREGRVFFLGDNSFGGMPQQAEMVYTLAMALHSGTTAATFGWAVGIVTLIGVGGFARRILNDQASWFAAAILLTGSSIAAALSWAYVDFWVMLFGLSMIICLDYYTKNGNPVWLFLAGIMAGFAMGTKYSAGVLLVIGCTYLLIYWIQLQKFQRGSWWGYVKSVAPYFFRDSFILCGISLAVFSPWLIKNWTFTGNPIYPFLLPGREFGPLRQSLYQKSPENLSLIDGLLYPLKATVLGIEGGVGFNTSIGPLMLALIPGLYLGWNSFAKQQKDSLKRLLLLALATWALWVVGSYFADALTRSRHYFGVFPIFAVLSVAGFQSVTKIRVGQIRFRRLISALIILTFLIAIVDQAFHFIRSNPLLVLTGQQSEKDYLINGLGWFGVVMNEINDLPTDSKVAFFWEPRAYYCHAVACSPDAVIDQWWYLRRKVGDSTEISKYLLSDGFTHVLIYQTGVDFVKEEDKELLRYTASDWADLERFRSELHLVKDYGGVYVLYELEY